MRSKNLAKVVIISLFILAILLSGLLVYSIAKYKNSVEQVVNENAEVEQAESESVEVEQAASENGEVDDESYEEDITRDELHDLVDQYVASIDEEGADEYLVSASGKVYPDEHYSLYNFTDSPYPLVVYSNEPNYHWLYETDWYATLCCIEDAASKANTDCTDGVVYSTTETTVDILDRPTPTYIFPYEDSVVVQAAILPDVILTVTSPQTNDPDIGLENFKSALDIRLVTD